MSTNDSFSVTTTQSWMSRIKGALAGIVIGPLLIIGAVCLLWWNEGRATRTTAALNEGKKALISVVADPVNPANEGKLVYLTGTATTEEILQDPELEVEQNALLLRRHSEMFQWVEKEASTSSKNLGGSETTTTQYSYRKEWSDKLIDSSNFKRSDGHLNPDEFFYPPETWVSSEATIGGFHLAEELIQGIGNETKVSIEPFETEDGIHVINGGFYIGEDPKSPEIGDVRVSHYAILPMEISVVAGQVDGSLTPFTSENGSTIALVSAGKHTADTLFANAHSENTLITWLVRLAGLVLAIVGFAMMMGILSIIADVVPIVGSVVGLGTGLVALVLGSGVAIITIAVAWFAYRPLLATLLLVVVAVLSVFVLRRRKVPATA